MFDKSTVTVGTPTNTADAINHLVDKASAGLDSITHAIASHAPQAWALAVHGVYAQGFATLMIAAICAAIFVVGGSLSVLCAFLHDKFDNLPQYAGGGRAIFFAAAGWVLGLLAVISLIVSLIFGLSPSDWTRVISPDGYLAQNLLDRATSSEQ